MAEDMIERAVKALEECCETDDAWHRRDLDDVPMPELARAALLAALDPEDEALQQLWGDVIDRFSDPASHHCMATFFAELKAMAQGETNG